MSIKLITISFLIRSNANEIEFLLLRLRTKSPKVDMRASAVLTYHTSTPCMNLVLDCSVRTSGYGYQFN